MNTNPYRQIICAVLALAWMLLTGGAAVAQNSFYKGPGLFSTRPSEKKSVQSIDRFGPVGMGIELHQPAFVMKIKNIEEGSPAAATGKLKKGQIIETINGQKLADIDPRIQLGRIIEKAEATDGVIRFMVKDQPNATPQQVIVNIPILGAYSKTWPLHCPKSDKIVRNFADYLAKPGSNKGFSSIGMLFLLSTGEDKDLPVVQHWARGLSKTSAPSYAWFLGFGGIPLCEYYLRTGDQQVLPTIQRWVESAEKGEFFGGWAGRGGVPAVTYGGGGGHLNAGGTAVVTFLMLAKECGANVNDQTLLRVLRHFYRFAGHGNNPYGNNRPENSFVDNGKNGNLALAMAAAASLTPHGEQSVYAKARDIAAMTGFYTTTYMLHGHTGGGIGEIWRSAAMGLLHDKKPRQYRQFMDHRKWHYDLSRRWDGSFGILGGARYDTIEWGAGYALAYTIPRKTLRITGAPKTPYVHEFQLPKRPWGTQADEAFVSLQAAADQDGHREDMSLETLIHDSAKPLIDRLVAMGDVRDDVLNKYAHHPDHMIRQLAANTAMGIQPSYMWIKRGGKIKAALFHKWIRSKDPRVRRVAMAAMNIAFPDRVPETYLTPDDFALIIKMIENPAESWWVKDAALQLVGRAPADWIVPHVDLLISYLDHEEWWLQNAALTALAPVVADERCYRQVLPAIGRFLKTCQLWNATAPVRWGRLPANLHNATNPRVQQLAAETLKEAYTGFTGIKRTPRGQDITRTYNSQMEFLASTLAEVPGGYDILYRIAKKRFPNELLPYSTIFLNADPSKFGPELKKAIGPIIRDKLVYQFMGKNRARLLAEINRTKQSYRTNGIIDDLTDLYRKIGVHDYDWHAFGPDLKNAKWDYYTFDPKEKQKYDISPWRYRQVTYPKGMEKWFMPDFNPRQAGWKKGLPPFGQYKGKLTTNAGPGTHTDIWPEPPRTLWENEVLLVRGTFRFPPLKPGHLYRLRVGTGQGVGAGDGFKVYLNGKPLVEARQGLGRGAGNLLRGGFITKEFVEEFNKGPVTIAAMSFLRYGDRAIVQMPPVPQGIFSIWLEEMKVPPFNDESLRKSATVIPMVCSVWQALQDPDNRALQPDEGKFRYDGKFVDNPKIRGTWTIIDQVKTIDQFNPDKRMKPRRAPFTTLTFKDKGLTSEGLWIWSGDMLMDLNRYQALKMLTKQIGGRDYLFFEAGGFSTRNKPGWTSPWYVMKRP